MTLERTGIVSRSDSTDLSDFYLDFPATDWYTVSILQSLFVLRMNDMRIGFAHVAVLQPGLSRF